MAVATKHLVVGVDDDFRVRESIESLVESAGYAPRMFACAEEFLQSGTLSGAICLIADVRMPGMDGLELQRRVRLQRPTLPVIFITAHYDEETRNRARNEGAVGFLCKPFNAVDLLEAIQAALTKASEN
jgi:FixJ family two-component response regulator